MVLLGIDYGRKYVGLALSTGLLAEPLTTLKVNPKLLDRLQQMCFKLEVRKIIIGISEGRMAEETREFARHLQAGLELPVVLQDETLTTHQAIQKLIDTKGKKKLGVGRKDKFAATLILQEYIDQTNEERLGRA